MSDITLSTAQLTEIMEVLQPFAKEADAWKAYHDDERLVEGFPEYYGDIRVKDVRRAKTLFKQLEKRHGRMVASSN